MNATTINWSGSPVGRPTTDTLTDRYVWAVLKGLPEAKRLDIDRELRASIADEVDARVAAGEDAAAAEHAVLLELGNPDRLAASYTGRTLGLIGPELYPGYVGLLKMLYVLVLPLVVGVYLIVQLVTGAEQGGAIGSTVAVALSLVVHLGFWTTLVFAIAERTGTTMKNVPSIDDGPFDPAKLPTMAVNTGTARSDLIASLVVLLLIPIALVWQQFAPFIGDDGDPLPVLQPSLWLVYFVGVAVLAAGMAVALYRRGRWTWLLVAVNAVLGLAFTVPIVVLLWTQQLLNPVLLEELGWQDAFQPGRTPMIAVTVTFAAILT
jgi:hypothetical protein